MPTCDFLKTKRKKLKVFVGFLQIKENPFASEFFVCILFAAEKSVERSFEFDVQKTLT